jgi:hypothetical protein
MPLQSIVLISLASAWASTVSACLPPERPTSWFDKRIAIATDGSFTNGEDNYYSSSIGLAVVDVGDGKIGQRLRVNHFCGYLESLLVVDCNTEDLIVISGRVDPDNPNDFGGGPSTTVDMLYPPDGKVALTRSTTIDDLVQISNAEGYGFETDPEVAFGGGKKRNRYNPFSGCGLFYPDSAGALQ